ncbi:MAG: Williams-Beuren syndrome chromosome region 16 protein [Marteilia pararefringens]
MGKIKYISMGDGFFALLNDNGEIFMSDPEYKISLPCMDSQYQNLSLRFSSIPLQMFNKNPFNPDTKIIQIHCGKDHIIALNSLGQIFCWGSNNFGQLGDLSFTKSTIPHQLIISSCLESPIISAGNSHTLILQ